MHSHGEDDEHEHHGSAEGGERELALVSIVNLVGFFVELAGGLLFGSVALISDAIHMLFDSLAYVMAYMAAFFAERYDDEDWSYGVHRIEPLAAFLNGVLLIPMIGYILWESYQRFLSPMEIGTVPTIAIGFGGLLINVVSVLVLQGDDMSLNERGAFYHLLGDAGGSIAVIVSTVVIHLFEIRLVDPIVASLIAVLISWSAIKVLRGSGAIFLHRTPLDIDAIRSDINGIEDIEGVEDLHAWQICSQITVATVHVKREESSDEPDEMKRTLQETHRILSDHGVDHATVEICYGCNDKSVHTGNHSH